MPLRRLSHEARALVLSHLARLYRVLLVRLPPAPTTIPGRMDAAGEGHVIERMKFHGITGQVVVF